MTSPGLQGWHVSLGVTVAILVIQYVADQVLKRVYAARESEPPPRQPSPAEMERQLAGKHLRIGVLAVLGSIAVPVFAVSFLGPTLADQLAGATGTGLGGLTLWLAWQTHKESKRLAELLKQLTETNDRRSGTGTPPP
ncbi:hypothetical protein [Actinoplanes derwentensis]|uniref:Uncharacterized protein n=1 Tax=Actinoplanes derwentensis TaxID=113562 RepID=A0A1H2C6T0_9ACTN|nr:hypothetical protein [Actinoplanes derwentensis]GID84248.1 hypothetical protein Ade03nite_31720 [Actinoplanes derwentensis]SDT66084.1 hypothetical protein SAMN04489716_5312 [Actinoplanes derwentensis]